MIFLYEPDDAKRNAVFIGELQRFSNGELLTWNDWTAAGILDLAAHLQNNTVLFRVRQPAAARSLEDQGVRLVNRAEVNRIANDKWQSYQLFQLLGVPAIPTFREPPGYPCVMKTADGHGGQEVELLESPPGQFKETNIFQPVVEHTADVRAYCIGNEVIGAVKRTAAASFKSNFSLGGAAERFCLSAEQEHDVLRVARALKSDYIGIDFLLLPDGRHLFNEVEDPVGARMFYATHEENIAERLCHYIREKELTGWRRNR